MTVIVKKLGGSLAVVIPSGMARDLGLRVGTPLDVSTSASSVVLRKHGRRARRPLSEIVVQIKPARYRRRSLELGEDHAVGKEIW